MNNPKSVQPNVGPYWINVGMWSYPTKKNGYFNYVIYHGCNGQLEASWILKEEDMAFDHCVYCKEKVPDGLKMIALLEKL